MKKTDPQPVRGRAGTRSPVHQITLPKPQLPSHGSCIPGSSWQLPVGSGPPSLPGTKRSTHKRSLSGFFFSSSLSPSSSQSPNAASSRKLPNAAIHYLISPPTRLSYFVKFSALISPCSRMMTQGGQGSAPRLPMTPAPAWGRTMSRPPETQGTYAPLPQGTLHL